MNEITRRFEEYVKRAEHWLLYGHDRKAQVYATLAAAMANTGFVEREVFEEGGND